MMRIIFPRKLLLSNKPISRLCKAFTNNSLLSKTQLHKIRQSGESLGRLLGPLLNAGLPLMKNPLKPLAKSVLTTLGLTVTALSSFRLSFGFTHVSFVYDYINNLEGRNG